jgi:hypothetical protein
MPLLILLNVVSAVKPAGKKPELTSYLPEHKSASYIAHQVQMRGFFHGGISHLKGLEIRFTCFPGKRHLNRAKYRENCFLPKILNIIMRWTFYSSLQHALNLLSLLCFTGCLVIASKAVTPSASVFTSLLAAAYYLKTRRCYATTYSNRGSFPSHATKRGDRLTTTLGLAWSVCLLTLLFRLMNQTDWLVFRFSRYNFRKGP